ncbi:hypothetical protein JNB88_31240 [Rhizobium cauense]|uniref:hypothetical protein n=1 Tax=Rhizobium cauense TaxID=1166683 RepID=UPI001C6F133C|nr:hypothetical protein [Rhizobium cauense]MBW9118090.1 hypothetical protein [Rhizobium cauense]
MHTTGQNFNQLQPQERQAIPERIAVTLEQTARWAADEGETALEMVMHSVGHALTSVAEDLAENDIQLAEDVAVRAISLITTFHCRHPQYPFGSALH